MWGKQCLFLHVFLDSTVDSIKSETGPKWLKEQHMIVQQLNGCAIIIKVKNVNSKLNTYGSANLLLNLLGLNSWYSSREPVIHILHRTASPWKHVILSSIQTSSVVRPSNCAFPSDAMKSSRNINRLKIDATVYSSHHCLCVFRL